MRRLIVEENEFVKLKEDRRTFQCFYYLGIDTN